MATVETVTGPIEASELGTTLIHEHLMARDEGVAAQWPDFARRSAASPSASLGRAETRDTAFEAGRAAVELGVRSICDPSAMFLGRDVRLMRDVSEDTGLQVVACTGIYTYDHLPQFFITRNPDQIAELFVADIERGIQGTEIKAAFIKCAADEPGVTENVEKVHRAAARPSSPPGPRSWPTRGRPATPRPRQIEIFEEEGVDPAKVQIAHTGDTDDLDYIERLLEKGVYIGMDRYGLEIYLPYEQRNADRPGAARARLRRADVHLGRLLRDARLVPSGGRRAARRRRHGQGLGHPDGPRSRVIPDLREGGMTDEQLETMTVRNPVSWLTGP